MNTKLISKRFFYIILSIDFSSIIKIKVLSKTPSKGYIQRNLIKIVNWEVSQWNPAN